MNQLDRIELKINTIIELVAMEPYFIKIPHEPHASREWRIAAKKQQQILDRLQQIHENTDNTSGKPDRIS